MYLKEFSFKVLYLLAGINLFSACNAELRTYASQLFTCKILIKFLDYIPICLHTNCVVMFQIILIFFLIQRKI